MEEGRACCTAMKEGRGIGILNAENYLIILSFPPVLVGVFSLAAPAQCIQRHVANCRLAGAV